MIYLYLIIICRIYAMYTHDFKIGNVWGFDESNKYGNRNVYYERF